MSVFKRANWHSGLIYQQTCSCCNTVVKYIDYELDYRPWYPNGFVYCPKCQTPLRHNENYAISEKTEQEEVFFCTNCGKQLKSGDNFCSNCGKKI